MASKTNRRGCSVRILPRLLLPGPMQILYLSHGVTNPPDKRKKIRAFQTVRHLTRTHHVHAVCFAGSEAAMAAAGDLAAHCQPGVAAHEGTSASKCVERR